MDELWTAAGWLVLGLVAPSAVIAFGLVCYGLVSELGRTRDTSLS